jgi:hypothetical protein
MRQIFTTLAVLVGLALVTSCERAAEQGAAKPAGPAASRDTHEHADGTTHVDHDAEKAGSDEHGHEHEGGMGVDHDHAHDEVPLGSVTIGDLMVELAQGHGRVEAGKESHLVVKLPHNDNGATTVRAWIGTEDRTFSLVGKGAYAPSHDDYDVHAVAPDPLPDDAKWWIEIEHPDGTKVVGSARLLK